MKSTTHILLLAIVLFTGATIAHSQTMPCIPNGSKIFINEMPEDFNTYMAAAFKDTKLPLLIVTDKEKADFEMSGTAAPSKSNSWARVIFAGQTGSRESASITITNIKTSVVVFSAASDRSNARRGKRSVANKMARELRDDLKEWTKKGCTLQ